MSERRGIGSASCWELAAAALGLLPQVGSWSVAVLAVSSANARSQTHGTSTDYCREIKRDGLPLTVAAACDLGVKSRARARALVTLAWPQRVWPSSPKQIDLYTVFNRIPEKKNEKSAFGELINLFN